MKNKYIPATHISFTHTKELLNIQSYSLQLILVKFNKIKEKKNPRVVWNYFSQQYTENINTKSRVNIEVCIISSVFRI